MRLPGRPTLGKKLCKHTPSEEFLCDVSSVWIRSDLHYFVTLSAANMSCQHLMSVVEELDQKEIRRFTGKNHGAPRSEAQSVAAGGCHLPAHPTGELAFLLLGPPSPVALHW